MDGRIKRFLLLQFKKSLREKFMSSVTFREWKEVFSSGVFMTFRVTMYRASSLIFRFFFLKSFMRKSRHCNWRFLEFLWWIFPRILQTRFFLTSVQKYYQNESNLSNKIKTIFTSLTKMKIYRNTYLNCYANLDLSKFVRTYGHVH